MKIDLTALLNKVNAYVKTNGNREITGDQLNEILVDFIGNAAEFQLKYGGVAVDRILNSATGGYDKSRTLLTWQAVISLLGGGNKSPWIGVDYTVRGNYDPGTFVAGDILPGVGPVKVNDRVYLSGQTNPAENGIYIVGTVAGDTVKSELFPDAASLHGVTVIDTFGTMVTCATNEAGETIPTPTAPETDNRITALEGDVSDLKSAVSVDKGFFVNLAALQTAHATGQDGWRAILGSTDTVWVWDSTTSAWVDTDTKGQVVSVNGKTADVSLYAADIPVTDNFTGNLAGKDVDNLALLASVVDALIVTPPITRHDNQGGYDYFASALYGSLENESVWTITRIQVQNDGTTTVSHAYNSQWTNRLTLTYS